jgi:hypothetical protein
MGRKATPRTNYRQDAIVMRRIMDAIEVDTTSNSEWKEKVTGYLHEAMRLFLEHTPRKETHSHGR